LQIIKDLVTLFPVIRDWIAEFLLDIKDMMASEIGRNMLIEQVRACAHAQSSLFPVSVSSIHFVGVFTAGLLFHCFNFCFFFVL